jgi:ABC-type dipeptide/oligopeptide/nickel transport system permease component
MALFVLRRLVLAIPLLIGITFISFLVIHLAPGDPVEQMAGDLNPDRSVQAMEQLRKLYGLDQPLHVQYWRWLSRIVRLDFGRSFLPDGKPVLEKIGERLPVTLALNIVQMLVIVGFSIPIGVLSATRQHSALDKSTTIFVFVGFATPDFWLALLPLETIVGLLLPGLIGGSEIIETVFAIPGMGQLMVQSVFARDYPVVVGGATVAAVVVALVNLGVDVLQVWVDPRIRTT